MKGLDDPVMILVLTNQKEAIEADSAAFGKAGEICMCGVPQPAVKEKESQSTLFHRG